MSENKDINNLYLKVAALERRISKLELGMQEIDQVIDPEGWIGEAFERVYEDIDQLKTEMDAKFSKVNGKLDAIWQRLTGMSE